MANYSPFWKPSRTARMKAKKEKRAARRKAESDAKADVRRRDRVCRFPLCGCRRLGLRLEVSHQEHKGAGGNPDGSRSRRSSMILLCTHRHQDGVFSRHKGTLRIRELTPEGTDGPVAFDLLMNGEWRMVARESRPGELEPLTPWQSKVIALLALMTE